MTDKSSNMLAKIGITIGKGNKLELDEDALKKSDISSLKSVFTGHNSSASKISQKATSIENAANRATATYTNNKFYKNFEYPKITLPNGENNTINDELITEDSY